MTDRAEPPDRRRPYRGSPFWDGAYRRGEHRRHWEPARGEPVEPAGLTEGGLPVPQELTRALDQDLLPPPEAGALAIDLGTGGGLEALELERHGYRVLGIETSRAALEVARGRQLKRETGKRTEDTGRAHWCQATAFRLPLRDSIAHLVLDRGLFHLLDDEDRDDYGHEVARILAPGGVLFLRGARHGDEEAGLVGLGEAALERAFPADRFLPPRIEAISLEAPAGDLPAVAVLVQRY